MLGRTVFFLVVLFGSSFRGTLFYDLAGPLGLKFQTDSATRWHTHVDKLGRLWQQRGREEETRRQSGNVL